MFNGVGAKLYTSSARFDKDRQSAGNVVPTNLRLTKRDLEDRYYELVQDNVELKKTVNQQSEKIKILSTKLQRALAVKTERVGDNTCCVRRVNDQRDVISELKNSNDRLKERIKRLNMQLCSAKQFIRRPGLQTHPGQGPKLFSTSTLNGLRKDVPHNQNNSRPESPVRNAKNCRVDTTLSVSINDNCGDVVSPKSCDNNKCKTILEDMQQKMLMLQQELSKTSDQYRIRIAELEQHLKEANREKKLLATKESSQVYESKVKDHAARKAEESLRAMEARCADLEIQLSIEKSKVSELLTQVKAVNLSAQVAKTIEEHLSKQIKLNPQKEIPSRVSDRTTTYEDSGYIEQYKLTEPDETEQIARKKSAELLSKIAFLRSELDSWKEKTSDLNKQLDASDCFKVDLFLDDPRPPSSPCKENNLFEESNTAFEMNDNVTQTPNSENLIEKQIQNTSAPSHYLTLQSSSNRSSQIDLKPTSDLSEEKNVSRDSTVSDFDDELTLKNVETHVETSTPAYNNSQQVCEKSKVNDSFKEIMTRKDMEFDSSTDFDLKLDPYEESPRRRRHLSNRKICSVSKSPNTRTKTRGGVNLSPSTQKKLNSHEHHIHKKHPDLELLYMDNKFSARETFYEQTKERGNAEDFNDTKVYQCAFWTQNKDNLNEVIENTFENTDNEISTLSDLPTEYEQTNPLSPGERRPDSLISTSHPLNTDYSSLSDGELCPHDDPKECKFIYKKPCDMLFGGLHEEVSSGSQNIESAMEAIKEELARCRQLLVDHRKEIQNPVTTWTSVS